MTDPIELCLILSQDFFKFEEKTTSGEQNRSCSPSLFTTFWRIRPQHSQDWLVNMSNNSNNKNIIRILNTETFPKQSMVFMTLRKDLFENILGKGENACLQNAFTLSTREIILSNKFNFLSANAFSLDQSNILLLG